MEFGATIREIRDSAEDAFFKDLAAVNFFDKVVHEPQSANKAAADQSVLFFTDRATSKSSDGNIDKFQPSNVSNTAKEITMGKLAVSNPAVLPSAFAAPAEEKAHAGQTTRMHVQETYSNRNQFLDSVQKQCELSGSRKIGIMVPGFGMTFDQGLSCTAKLQQESGMPMVYDSWPSRDAVKLSAYIADEKNDEKSMKAVGGPMIDAIADRIGANNIVIVGFSQGSKIATQYAIDRQQSSNGTAQPFFAQAFTRSDGARTEFQNNISDVLNNAEHTALYNSPHDRLLIGSASLLHQHNFRKEHRTGTGLAKDFIVPDNLNDRFEVIDNSSANNGGSNHIFDSSGVAAWLKTLK
jgi:esterase/lipase superfamily enzyme